MIPLCIVTPDYYDANEEAILAVQYTYGLGNAPRTIGEDGMILCRGVDPAELPDADVYELPAPLQDEGEAAYQARMATAATGAFNKVKNGPKEIFLMRDEKLIHQCRKMNGWPEQAGE